MPAANLQPIVDAVTKLDTLEEGIIEYIRLLNEKIQNAGTLEEAQAIAAEANRIHDSLAAAIVANTP